MTSIKMIVFSRRYILSHIKCSSFQNCNVLQSDKFHGSVLDVEKSLLTRLDTYVPSNCRLIMTMLHRHLTKPKETRLSHPASQHTLNKSEITSGRVGQRRVKSQKHRIWIRIMIRNFSSRSKDSWAYLEKAELKEHSKSVIAVWDLDLHMEPERYTTTS